MAGDKVKAYLIPYKAGKKLGFGKDGFPVTGPMIIVPGIGAIVYKIGFTGDCEAMGEVLTGIDYFEYRKQSVTQMEKGMRGQPLEGYQGEEFDLSKGVREFDVDEQKFVELTRYAENAYNGMSAMKIRTMQFTRGLEGLFGLRHSSNTDKK